MTSAVRNVDDEFVDYVRARQDQLVRAAYLVCGDLDLAREVTQEALGALLLRWHRVGDESPDLLVRRRLYREAMLRRVRTQDGPRRGPDLEPGLARLTRRQRAAAVLVRFEERGETEAADVLGISVTALRRLTPPVTRDALLDAAAAVPGGELGAGDVVERARRGAAVRRRHAWRGWVGTVAAAGLLAGALVVLPDGPSGRVVPGPAPAPTATGQPVAGAEWDPTPFALRGTLAQVGPSEEQLASVPTLDDLSRGQLNLPEVLSFGPRTQMPTLSEFRPRSAPVRAVLLRHTADGLRAVLFRPTASNPFVLVDTVPLVPNVDEAGRSSSPLEVTAVADDRRHVLFVQPGKVVVLDAFTSEVRTYPVPDRHLDHGGWTRTSVITWSRTARWRVDRRTGQVHRLSQHAVLGPHRVSVEGREQVRIHTYDDAGSNLRTRGGPDVLSGTWGETFTSPSDSVATGGFLGPDAALEANQRRPERLFQGVLVVPGDEGGTPRLLIAPFSEGVAVGCCEVLGWVYRDQVLVRWRTTELLSWNTTTGALLRVATLPGAGEGTAPGSPAVSVAIAP